jgi:hypothetical protein
MHSIQHASTLRPLARQPNGALLAGRLSPGLAGPGTRLSGRGLLWAGAQHLLLLRQGLQGFQLHHLNIALLFLYSYVLCCGRTAAKAL